MEREVTRKRVALYTFGIFRAPAADPRNQGFHDRNDLNFVAAESSERFIARSGYDDEPGPESWGDHGPTAWAFDFKQPFDESGQRTVLNREMLKQYVENNQARQALLSLWPVTPT